MDGEPDCYGWAVAFGADGRLVAIADTSNRDVTDDARVRIWDVRRQQVVQTLQSLVGDVAFSRDGTRIVTGGVEEVFVWKT